MNFDNRGGVETIILTRNALATIALALSAAVKEQIIASTTLTAA